MKPRELLPLVLFGVLLGCPGVGERTDSTKVIPVEDINAQVTTPPPPPSPITRLSILDSLPYGGICTVTRYRAGADLAREITYETLSPRRTYVIEVGKPPRAFAPTSLDMRGTQTSPGLTETENVFVGFSEDGHVSVGTRRYSSTGETEANDRAPLRMGDSAIALAFAREIMNRCDTGR